MRSPFILPHKFNGRVPTGSDFLRDREKVIQDVESPETPMTWDYYDKGSTDLTNETD